MNIGMNALHFNYNELQCDSYNQWNMIQLEDVVNYRVEITMGWLQLMKYKYDQIRQNIGVKLQCYSCNLLNMIKMDKDNVWCKHMHA